MSSTSTFAELLSQARLGDKAALASLAAEYEPQLRIVARARLGPALRPYLDSIDLVQSVHRSLLIGLREEKFNISSPAALVALALTIVRRKVARQWRHLRRYERLENLGNDPSALSNLFCSLSSPEDDPAALASMRERTQQLLSELTEPERQLIELRLAGCTTAEAARRLGCDPDVLRVRLSRLRRRLRDRSSLSEWL